MLLLLLLVAIVLAITILCLSLVEDNGNRKDNKVGGFEEELRSRYICDVLIPDASLPLNRCHNDNLASPASPDPPGSHTMGFVKVCARLGYINVIRFKKIKRSPK